MPKIAGDKLRRVHIQVHDDDWQYLLTCFGDSVARSAVIRDIVHNFVKATRERAARNAKQVVIDDEDTTLRMGPLE